MNSVPEVSKLYEDFEPARSLRDEEVEELMASLIPASGKLRVLDVGCGLGTMTMKINKIHDCYGIDSSPKLVEQARRIEGERIQFALSDANSMPFKSESFDFIISKNLLEHCPRPFDVLLEFNRVVRLGGAVVICVPNEMTIGSLIVWVLTDLLHPKNWNKSVLSTYHFYFWNRIFLGYLVKYAGFELRDSKALTFGFPFLRHGRISRILAKYFPTLSTPVIIKAVKAERANFFFEEIKSKRARMIKKY
jgi:ubiquinone/menaquinone biosynthesis C-methylase UbiE